MIATVLISSFVNDVTRDDPVRVAIAEFKRGSGRVALGLPRPSRSEAEEQCEDEYGQEGAGLG